MILRPGVEPNVSRAFHAVWIAEQAAGVDLLLLAVWKSARLVALPATLALLGSQALFLVYFFRVLAPRLKLSRGSLRIDLPPIYPALWLATTGPLALAFFFLFAVKGVA